jgi:hypothetical protein
MDPFLLGSICDMEAKFISLLTADRLDWDSIGS